MTCITSESFEGRGKINLSLKEVWKIFNISPHLSDCYDGFVCSSSTVGCRDCCRDVFVIDSYVSATALQQVQERRKKERKERERKSQDGTNSIFGVVSTIPTFNIQQSTFDFHIWYFNRFESNVSRTLNITYALPATIENELWVLQTNEDFENVDIGPRRTASRHSDIRPEIQQNILDDDELFGDEFLVNFDIGVSRAAPENSNSRHCIQQNSLEAEGNVDFILNRQLETQITRNDLAGTFNITFGLQSTVGDELWTTQANEAYVNLNVGLRRAAVSGGNTSHVISTGECEFYEGIQL